MSKQDRHFIEGVIVSSAIIAAGFGALLGGAFADRVGRKMALLVGDVLFASGALMMGLASSVGWVVGGR